MSLTWKSTNTLKLYELSKSTNRSSKETEEIRTQTNTKHAYKARQRVIGLNSVKTEAKQAESNSSTSSGARTPQHKRWN